MQLRTILVIGLALFCGLLAVVGINLFLQAQEKQKAPEESVEVLVSTRDIDRLDKVTADMLTTRSVPKSLVPKEALTDADDVVGRVVLLKCYKGDLVLKSQLAKKGSGYGIAAATPDGMRAFTLKINKIAGAVTGFVHPGDRVDVLMTVTMTTAGKDGTMTLTLLTNIEVVAVDQVTEEPTPDKKAKVPELKSVTLLVSPEQASKLAPGENKGSLHLSLRNPTDKLHLPPTKISLKDIGLEEEKPVVAKAPPKPKLQAPPHIRMLHGSSEAKVYIYPFPPAPESARA